MARKSKSRIADARGRIANPGSWSNGEIKGIAEKILGEAKVCQTEAGRETVNPLYSEDLIQQYEFFRNNVYEPKRVFYPCCGNDASPARGFPNSEVIFLDNAEYASEAMKKFAFVNEDAKTYKPEHSFDLIIILNPALPSRFLTKHLICGGYVLANNYHNNASQLFENQRFDGIGTLERNENGIFLAKNFNRLEKNQWDTYLYVFRKLGGRKWK